MSDKPPNPYANIAGWVDLKKREFFDLPNQNYKKPYTALMLSYINKFFLFIGVFAQIWFLIIWSFNSGYKFLFVFTIAALFFLFLGLFVLVYNKRLSEEGFGVLLLLAALSVSVWLVQLSF